MALFDQDSEKAHGQLQGDVAAASAAFETARRLGRGNIAMHLEGGDG